MLLIQMTGLSGAGKSSIAVIAEKVLTDKGYEVEVLDGDHCRRHICRDLGFSRVDRLENIRRLGFVGLLLAKHNVITLLAAINPYEEAREALKKTDPCVKTIFIDCPLALAMERDTKGLYRRAILSPHDPGHIQHFTGISDPYEVPLQPDLTINTSVETKEQSAKRLTDYILQIIQRSS
jgi:adenylylsulfate kinase